MVPEYTTARSPSPLRRTHPRCVRPGRVRYAQAYVASPALRQGVRPHRQPSPPPPPRRTPPKRLKVRLGANAHPQALSAAKDNLINFRPDELILKLSGDNGQGFTKITISLAHASHPNSPANNFIVAAFPANDKRENLSKFCGNIWQQIDQLNQIAGKKIKLFFGGDLSFLWAIIGHCGSAVRCTPKRRRRTVVAETSSAKTSSAETSSGQNGRIGFFNQHKTVNEFPAHGHEEACDW
ncbi:hypothetical protein niasHS_017002 [Heterodera schachtii]|uniref:Uncharacterized protein n=1 Tax=Heterodera schachtii TaxID=97005 RepID=A0ABD2I5X4_HETSC